MPVTSAEVTTLDSYAIGDKTGKQRGIRKRMKITITADGATVADIPASALGFSRLDNCFAGILDVSGTLRGVSIAISPDQSELVPISLVQATDANRTLRADISGDLYITVDGLSL